METIQQYKANDDKIFNSSEECIRYESILLEITNILSTLPKVDNTNCSFSNGEGYIQHNLNIYNNLETLLVKLANKWFKPKETFICFNYYLGRVIDDSNMQCLNKLTNKLMCIDKQYREWGQPYFAINPTKGEQKQLN